MKNLIITLIAILSFANIGNAQTATTSNNSSIASGLGLYVFPAKKQSQTTQNDDETACYTWAKQQTGVDPMNPPKVAAEQVNTAPNGSAIKGGAGGAAAGAAIGAIAGNTGEGAAIGAVLGGLRGRRENKEKEAEQQQANNQAASSDQKALMANFNKAFTACLQGKGYTVN